MSKHYVTCIGCDRKIQKYCIDDNGETGCEACFTEDGSGHCTYPHLFEGNRTHDQH